MSFYNSVQMSKTSIRRIVQALSKYNLLSFSIFTHVQFSLNNIQFKSNKNKTTPWKLNFKGFKKVKVR